jgi:hypothetical protein
MKTNSTHPIIAGLIAVFSVLALCLQAQDYIHEGDIVLENQVQVNNFSNTNPNTTVIKGNLTIGNFYSKTNISDLTPLTKLLIVEGVVSVANTVISDFTGLHKLLEVNTLVIADNDNLTSLVKLEALEKIHNRLQIDNNDLITNLYGFEQITQIGDTIFDYLQIFNNANLQSLEGIENLQVVTGNLNISFNPLLQSVEALENINHVGRYLKIEKNESLLSLAGLDSVNYAWAVYVVDNANLLSLEHLGKFNEIPNILSIEGNAKISSLHGLEHIQRVEDDVTISDNDALTELTGLDNLEHIGGGFEISDNPKLTNLNGLGGLTFVSSETMITDNETFSSFNGLSSQVNLNGGLSLWGNQNLSSCAIPLICQLLANEKYFYAFNNKQGCNSNDEVMSACSMSSINVLNSFPSSLYFAGNRLVLQSNRDTDISIQIYNQIGSLLFETNVTAVNGESKIAIPKLPKGIYFVQVLDNSFSSSYKLLKQE